MLWEETENDALCGLKNTKNMCSTKVRVFQVFGGTREHDHFISREKDIFLELISENKGISTTKGNFDNKV